MVAIFIDSFAIGGGIVAVSGGNFQQCESFVGMSLAPNGKFAMTEDDNEIFSRPAGPFELMEILILYSGTGGLCVVQ